MKILMSLLGVAVLSLALVGCGSQAETAVLNSESRIEDSDSVVDPVQDATSSEVEVPAEEVSVSDEVTEEADAKSDGPTLTLMESLSDGRGTDIYFEDYRGKMLFVNFFGTWCTYCIKEMPDFQKFTDNYSDQANIVLVNALETESIDMAGVIKWYEDGGYTMQMVFDEDRSKTADFYGAIQGFPTTFVFDENLEFLGYIPGMMDYTMLEGIVSEYGPK